MKHCKIRYVVLTVLCCIAVSRQAAAKSSGGMAFDLNERAISYLWNNLDSAEQYARYALEVSGRHSDERAKAVNTLARIAFMRMDFTRSWELYSSVPAITRNMLEVVASEIGLMRICQRTSDNVSFYEYRNRILLDLRALHEEQETLNDAQTERLLSLERSFRMESARYWFELEQLGLAGHEMSYVVADNLLSEVIVEIGTVMVAAVAARDYGVVGEALQVGVVIGIYTIIIDIVDVVAVQPHGGAVSCRRFAVGRITARIVQVETVVASTHIVAYKADILQVVGRTGAIIIVHHARTAVGGGDACI